VGGAGDVATTRTIVGALLVTIAADPMQNNALIEVFAVDFVTLIKQLEGV